MAEIAFCITPGMFLRLAVLRMDTSVVQSLMLGCKIAREPVVHAASKQAINSPTGDGHHPVRLRTFKMLALLRL